MNVNYQSTLESKMEALERRNRLLEAEVERLRVYKDYAYTDPLTEIPNRRFYYERLLQEISRARRGKRTLTLALLDLVLLRGVWRRPHLDPLDSSPIVVGSRDRASCAKHR